jgi:type II secretory pathway component GspD/PulD (secretin)
LGPLVYIFVFCVKKYKQWATTNYTENNNINKGPQNTTEENKNINNGPQNTTQKTKNINNGPQNTFIFLFSSVVFCVLLFILLFSV